LTGHTAVDAAGYRDGDEVAERWRHDPIARAMAMLVDAGMTTTALDDINSDAHRAMAAVLDEARASNWPDLRQVFTDVQDTHGQGLTRSS
jgi:pyruvate dehydrogenase E1 component alpha subunit